MASSVARIIVQIDGSFCEGGGQLLRNAVAFSALLSKPVSISNIRLNRRPPGLQRQHVAGINLAAAICSAETKGVEVDSTTIEFRPSGPIQLPQTLTADPGTAGSTALLLQVALPCLLLAPPPPNSGHRREPSAPHTHAGEDTADSEDPMTSVLTLYGGTNAALAPQIDYAQHVLLPFLSTHLRVSPSPILSVHRRGYFPRGGGVVLCTVPAISVASASGRLPLPLPLPCVVLTERGRVRAVRGEARVGGLPLYLAQRMIAGAHRVLLAHGIPASLITLTALRERDADVVGAGGGILLWAETDAGCVLAGSAVSTREKRPEAVGEEAALDLVRNLEHGGCVDAYLQDQMIVFLALAEGRSVVRTGPLTDHTRTAIYVAKLMTGARFHVDENASGGTIITCEGIGYVPSSLPATHELVIS